MKNVTDYSRYVGRGQLEDVTDLVTDYPDGKLAGTDGYDQDGKYFAVPYRQDFWVLYYNKALFDAAGVDYPDARDLGRVRRPGARSSPGTDAAGQKVYGTYKHIWRSVTQAAAQAQNEGADLLSGDYGFLKDQYDLNVGLQKDGYALDYVDGQDPAGQLPDDVRHAGHRDDADGHLVHLRDPAGQEGRQVHGRLGHRARCRRSTAPTADHRRSAARPRSR